MGPADVVPPGPTRGEWSDRPRREQPCGRLHGGLLGQSLWFNRRSNSLVGGITRAVGRRRGTFTRWPGSAAGRTRLDLRLGVGRRLRFVVWATGATTVTGNWPRRRARPMKGAGEQLEPNRAPAGGALHRLAGWRPEVSTHGPRLGSGSLLQLEIGRAVPQCSVTPVIVVEPAKPAVARLVGLVVDASLATTGAHGHSVATTVMG